MNNKEAIREIVRRTRKEQGFPPYIDYNKGQSKMNKNTLANHIANQVRKDWSNMVRFDSLRVVRRVARVIFANPNLPANSAIVLTEADLRGSGFFLGTYTDQSMRQWIRNLMHTQFGIPVEEFGISIVPDKDAVLIVRKGTTDHPANFGNSDLDKLYI